MTSEELGEGSIRSASVRSTDDRGVALRLYGRDLYWWEQLPAGLNFVAPDYMAMPVCHDPLRPHFLKHLRRSHLGFVPWGLGETPLSLASHLDALVQSPALGRNSDYLRNWLWTHESVREHVTFLQDARSLLLPGERASVAPEFLTAAQVVEFGRDGVERWLREADAALVRSRRLLERRGVLVA